MVSKGEKITDPAMLERLKLARAKALANRQAKAQAKKDEQLVKEIEDKQKRRATQNKLKELIDPEPKSNSVLELADPQPKTKAVLEEEEEPEVIIMKKKKKPKKKVVVVEESSSDDEPEPIIVKKKKKKQPKVVYESDDEPEQPQNTPFDDIYHRYYGR